MAYTSKAVRIDTWFNTDNHVFFKILIASFGYPGGFVVSGMSRYLLKL